MLKTDNSTGYKYYPEIKTATPRRRVTFAGETTNVWNLSLLAADGDREKAREYVEEYWKNKEVRMEDKVLERAKKIVSAYYDTEILERIGQVEAANTYAVKGEHIRELEGIMLSKQAFNRNFREE